MHRSFRLASYSILIMLAACSDKKETVDRTKFEFLYRSAKTIEAATTTGTSLGTFRELMQKASAELSIARDKASGAEDLRIVELFSRAIDAYADSLKLWNTQIELSQQFTDGIPCQASVSEIALKYQLKCLSFDAIEYIPKESLQYLWTLASCRLIQANSAYLGTPLTDKQKEVEAYKERIYSSELAKLKQISDDRKAREDQARREREAAIREKQEEKDRIQKKWDHLVRLSKMVEPGVPVRCINRDGALYHKNGCPLLSSDSVCVRMNDVPANYEFCPICSK
jgi:hypothetical protein